MNNEIMTLSQQRIHSRVILIYCKYTILPETTTKNFKLNFYISVSQLRYKYTTHRYNNNNNNNNTKFI